MDGFDDPIIQVNHLMVRLPDAMILPSILVPNSKEMATRLGNAYLIFHFFGM